MEPTRQGGLGMLGAVRRLALPLSIALTAVMQAACGSQTTRHVGNRPVRLPKAGAHNTGAPGASLSLLTPSPGSSERGTFTARVVVHGFRLVRPGHKSASRPRVGHLHFILDSGRYDEPQHSGPNGVLALRLGVNGFYSPAYGPSIVYRGIPTGPHVLRVELVNNDDQATGVSRAVSFHVR